MKQYGKELVILLLQTSMFYVFPLFAGPTDVFGMVLLIFLSALILPFCMGLLSRLRVKYLFPVAVALLFLPSIPIYYNPSALIYAVWLLVLALFGVAGGSLLRWALRY